MTGLSLYAAASIGAALAPGVTSLLAARLAQALGGCAGLVLGRAMVRDTAGPQDSARRLALMNLMVIAGPGLAPIAGGLIASHLGWRAIFVFLAALGVSLLVLAATLLPETGARTHVPVRVFARNYRGLLASPVFLGLAIGGGCATTSMYAFIAAAPFIFTGELHRPPEEVGLYLALLILGAWCGSAVTGRLLARVSLGRLLVGANALSLLAALAFLATVLSDRFGVASTVATMVLFTFGAGIASPAALTLAVGVNPAVIGSASGLYGFTQMAVGALCTALAGLGGDPALAAAAVLAGAGLLAQACFWIALHPSVQRPS